MLYRDSTRSLLMTLCLIVWLTGASAVAAQDLPVNWQPMNGPGGRIIHLTAGPDGQVLYAVSAGDVNRQNDQTQWREAGRIYRADAIYHSTDGGVTWQPMTNDLPPGPIGALYLDPKQDVLYAGVQGIGDDFTRRYGLWQTNDQKTRWEPAALGRDDLLIRRVMRDASGDALVVGAIDSGKYPNSYVYRLNANGQWTSTRALRFEQRPGSILADLIAHPTVPDRLFITTYGGDLFISDDAGQTWSLAQTSMEQGASGMIAQLVFSPDRPNTALLVRSVTRADGESFLVERSTDAGVHWSQLSASGLPSSGGPRTLAALPQGIYLLNTTAGTFRSADNGITWQPLEGALSSGGVSMFLALAEGNTTQAKTVLAATGYGIFISRDAGAIWQPIGTGLPFNSKIGGLLTHPARPDQVFAISDTRTPYGATTPPAVLRSLDGGKRWAPAAQNLPNVPITAWAIAPNDPDTLLLASWEHVFLSSDAGVSWRVTRLALSQRTAAIFAPSDPDIIYLAGRPASRSSDRGATWQEMPIFTTEATSQTEDVNALAVDPDDAQHLWAGLANGVYESRDGGRSWHAQGLIEKSIGWLAVMSNSSPAVTTLYAGVAEEGIYRWDGTTWTISASGIPAQSTLIAFAVDAKNNVLWTARDGGGIYRSTDAGDTWTNAAVGVGDNLAQALAISYDELGAVFIGTANAGVWKLTGSVAVTPSPSTSEIPAATTMTRAGIDARIEIVWPHDWASVTEAQLANIGLRLFMPGSLLQPACGWRPKVTVWQAMDTAPAAPLAAADQRSVDRQPFPYWILNDVDISYANDPAHKLYFLVSVEGVETATSIWAHGADPRTYLPQPDVPSGIATGAIDAVDARIQIVWPHDDTGVERSVTEASLVNISVTFFKHGTRLSVPVNWRPAGVSLYGAWNQEVGKPLAGRAEVVTRQAGVITYPTWEFNNVPVSRAVDPQNKLYLWANTEGVQTYPTIWAHGADSRTFFPAQDEPIQGCVP